MIVRKLTALRCGDTLEFDYVNHRGKDRSYTMDFIHLEYGTVPNYYPEPTWLLRCYNSGKGYRSFDLTKIRNLKVNGQSVDG